MTSVQAASLSAKECEPLVKALIHRLYGSVEPLLCKLVWYSLFDHLQGHVLRLTAIALAKGMASASVVVSASGIAANVVSTTYTPCSWPAAE